MHSASRHSHRRWFSVAPAARAAEGAAGCARAGRRRDRPGGADLAACESFLPLESRHLFSAVSPLALAEMAGLVSTSASGATVALPRSGPRIFGGATGPGTVSAARALMRVDQFAADARFAGITGAGYSTVIIDTGINLSHPFFGPDLNGDGVADRIVYHDDFADQDASAADVNGHGSNVSSIVASSDAEYPGIAPGAGIIALKVFSDSGSGTFGSIERALQWTIANAVFFNIVSVNLSLGDGGNHAGGQSLYGIGDELAVLAAMNVIVVAAAGNSFAQFGHAGAAYPAADSNVIAVGAVYSDSHGGFTYGGGASASTTGADRIAPFSQRSPTIPTVFAVGAPVSGASSIAGTITMHGTSQASPQIAGIAVLAQHLAMQTIGRRLTVSEFRTLLVTTGATIIDGDDEQDNVPNTGAAYRRVDLLAMGEAILNLAPPPAPDGNTAPTLSSVATLFGARVNRAGLISHGLLVAASDASDTDGDAIGFRVASISAGVLLCNGALVVPGQTIVGPGDWLIYLPPRNVQGTISAFRVQAFDGFQFSGVTATVRIDIRPRALFASRVTQQGDGTGDALTAEPESPPAVASAGAVEVGEPARAPRFLVAGDANGARGGPRQLAGEAESRRLLGETVTPAERLFAGEESLPIGERLAA